MNKMLLLTKIMLKNSASVRGAQKGRGWKRALILLTIAIGVAPMVVALVALVASLYDGLAQIGQESALLGLGVAGTSLAIFLLGIIYVLTVFYYSQDVEHFLPMPLLARDILGAKFLVALLYEYMTSSLMIMPIFITFGVKSGGGVLYYLVSLLVFIALPIVPLALAALVVMLFMRYTNFGKSKDRFRLIGGLLAIAAAVGFQAFIQRQSSGTDNSLEQVQQMIAAGDQGLLGVVTQLFPASKLAALAMFENGSWIGLGNLIAFYAAAAVGAAVFLIAGSYLYFAGVMGISESKSKRMRVEEAAFQKGVRSRPAWLAYAEKEWKILWRTPAFFMNCALSSIFLPLFALIPLLSRRDSEQMLATLSAWLQGEHAGGISLACFFAAILIIAGTNSTSSTAITRDGQGFFLNKSLPIPYGQILLAKLIPGVILSVIGTLLLLAEAVWLLKVSWLFVVLSLAAGLPGILFLNLLGIILDMQMPKLNWSSEQEAVKQNLTPLFSILFGIVSAGLCILAGFLLQASLIQMSLGLFLLFALADYLLYRVLVKQGPVWLEKLEG